MILGPLWNSEVETRVRAEARNLDEQDRPTEVKFCTRCVISNQRPRIVFDEDGVCSACRYAERKKDGSIDWKQREKELHELLKTHRKGCSYDVVVPCSGGKDSSTVAHRLRDQYRMHPLCAKWAPFLYTDVGRRNLENFVQSGFDTLVCHPGGLIHRKLARLAFEFYGDPFVPFIYGQLAWPMNAAVRFNVPLVFYGENGEAEYGGDSAANDKPCWGYDDWQRVYMKGAGLEKLIAIGLELGALTLDDVHSLSPFYRLPPLEEIKERGVEFHWFSYYRPWHPQENFYYASERTGFEPNDERSEGTYSKYASLDDKLDPEHYFMGYIKFGIGRATSDAAHEVRDGDITRDEAITLVWRYDGEIPHRHHQECLEYLGLDEEQYWHIIKRFKPVHLWDGDELKHTVYKYAAVFSR